MIGKTRLDERHHQGNLLSIIISSLAVKTDKSTPFADLLVDVDIRIDEISKVPDHYPLRLDARIFENVELAGFYGQGGHSRARADEAAEKALAMVGLPTDRRAPVDGLGAAGLKKLELAKALATGPKLLLADESLGGLDEAEMDQAADMLRKIRDELGITIIWVEHIMGVLMRVVDRVMVLDHGEKISEGLPSAVAGDPRVVEVYLGTDADATQAVAAQARR